MEFGDHGQFKEVAAQEPRRKEQYLKILNSAGFRIEAGNHVIA
jgi:hypothetical protein